MYVNIVEENVMYQQLQKISGESLYKKVFRANLAKSGQNILRTPKKLLAPTPVFSNTITPSG